MRVTRLSAAGAAVALTAGLLMTVSACGSIAACGNGVGTGTPGAETSMFSAPGGTGPIVRPGTEKEPASPTATTARALSGTITLVTGDKVHVDHGPDGAVNAAPVTSGTGGSPGFVTLTWAGDQFMIPDEAAPFLGSVLDPRLFDVSYLARAGLSDEASAVTIAKSRVSRLGSLLATAWRSGGKSDAASTLRTLGQISLAPPAGSPAPPAPFPVSVPAAAGSSGNPPAFHTVTMNFTGQDGKPATGIGWLQNLDDAQLSVFVVNGGGTLGDIQGVAGPVNASVPAGNYSMQFTVLTPNGDTASLLGADAALVVKPNVKVDSDQTATFDARSAVPYQATVTGGGDEPGRMDWLDFTRISTSGGACTGASISMGLLSATGAIGLTSPNQLAATPVSQVTEGGIGFDAATLIDTATPAEKSAAPRYYLDFPSQGSIPASLRYSVPFGKFSQVKQDVHATPGGVQNPCAAELWPNIYERWGAAQALQVYPADLVDPGQRTDYWYSGDPALNLWQPELFGDDCAVRFDEPRKLTPGQPLTEDWNSGPAVPSAVGLRAAGFYSGEALSGDPERAYVPAARLGDIGLLEIQPVGDGQDSHFGAYSGPIPSTVDFYRDGQLAFSSAQSPATAIDPVGVMLPMLPHAASYRLDWNVQRGQVPESSTDTDWTFRSGPDDPVASLPDTEQCAPDPKTSCSFLPLLFINYHLALNDESQAAAGKPFDVAFSVSHQQGAPAPSGLSATVSASFDDGKSWSSPVDAARTGPGAFGMSIDQPPLTSTSGFASLRVTVHDGAGDAVTQTVIRAYALS